MPNQLPYFDSTREYESFVHLYRVDMGLTHRKLSILSGVPMTDISALANGMKAPLLEDGELCLSAQKLCIFFGVEAEKLFPRYFCSLNNKFKFENTPYETYSERISNSALSQIEDKEYIINIFKILIDRYPCESRGVKILIRWCIGETYNDIAKIEGVSTERIRQMISRTLKRLQNISYKIDKKG